MIYQMSAPVEILDVKIDVSFTCRTCGTVIRKLTIEKEVAMCNNCPFKTRAFLETCKMKVNVIHSQIYFEVELSSQIITQFVKNVIKFQGKRRSEWMNINNWPLWKNKRVELVFCLSDEKWSCIGIKELEEDFKPVPNPQVHTIGKVSRQDEDIGFVDKEVKVEEAENADDGARQNVQGEKQEEGREMRHELGDGMRVDEAVVRRNQKTRDDEREHDVQPKIEDVDFEEEGEQRRVPEGFNDVGLRGYDDMNMDYDDFGAVEGDGRQRKNFDDGDLNGDGDDMDLDVGRDNERDEEEGSHESSEVHHDSESDEGEESSGDDSDSEQESDEEEEEDDSDEEPEQKQTKRRSVKAVTPNTVHRKIQSKNNGTKPQREYFSVKQREVLFNEFQRESDPSREQRKKIAEKTKLTVKQVTTWFRGQRYMKKNPDCKKNRGINKKSKKTYSYKQMKILTRAFEVNQNPSLILTSVMIYQMSAPVEILDVKIDVSFTCRMCGTVIRKLMVEEEIAMCNNCPFKTRACLETCKMKVNVIHSQIYFEVELSSQTITQFVKNVIKFQGKRRSEWMNINNWPLWKNKRVELVFCLSDEKWSCIGIKELEEDFKAVPNPQMHTNGKVSRPDEDIGFEDREVKVEEAENADDGARQYVQGEKQEEGREMRHEHGGGIDEAVVRRNQKTRDGKMEHAVQPKIEDVEFGEEGEQHRIPEDFNDEELRRYDQMDMEYDDFEVEEGDGRQRRNFDDGDLNSDDDMDMDLDLGRDDERDEEEGSHESSEVHHDSDSDEGKESSGDDSDSEHESEGDDEEEEEDDSDVEPEQKQTKRRSVRAVTPNTVRRKIQLKKKNDTGQRREFSVEQKEVLRNELKKGESQ